MPIIQSYDSNNIFARICRGEIPCKKVYEDDFVLAFHDAFPKAPVHILVIPKEEGYSSFDDFSMKADPKAIAAFFQSIPHIVRQFGLEKTGYRLITNHLKDSGQEIYHFHLHILGGKLLGPLL